MNNQTSSPSKPRVLVVTNDFPPRFGGIETFAYEITKRLDCNLTDVYTSYEPDHLNFDHNQSFKIIRIKNRYLLPTRKQTKNIGSYCKKNNISVVWFAASAPLGSMAKQLRKYGVKKIIMTTHGHELWWLRTPFTKQYLKRIFKNADYVTYLGEYFGSKFKKLSPNTNFVKLSPGVEPTEYKPNSKSKEILIKEFNLQEDANIIVCVGRLIPRKGQDTLIKSMDQIVKNLPNTYLIIAGKGPYESKLHDLREKMNSKNNIILTGLYPSEKLPNLYSGADLFAMPCRARKNGLEVEGLGIVFLEAQASGTPVLVGDSGGAPDAVIDNETGYIVDPTDVNAISEKILSFLVDKEKKEIFGKNGIEWVNTNWTWDRKKEEIFRLFTNQ